jgi:hypothetical protein
VAFAVQFHHHTGAEYRVVLSAPHPLGQLPTRPRPHGQLAVVERHKPRVKLRGGRPPAALAGGLDGALPARLRVARRHAKAVPLEGLAQRRPGGPSSAAAALTLPSRSASRKARSASPRSVRKRVGCQPTRCWACKAPLIGVDEGSSSIRRWVDRLQAEAQRAVLGSGLGRSWSSSWQPSSSGRLTCSSSW